MKNKRVNFVVNSIILLVILTLGTTIFFVKEPKSESVDVISKGKNCVALTFNVYENTAAVESILETLNKYSVTATFFLGGCWINKNKECLKKIIDFGNEIGSHGYYHYSHDKLSLEENVNEISKSIRIIEDSIDYKVTLFAPPSGAYNQSTIKACEQLNLRVILWTRDTIDWRDHDVEIIKSRALKAEQGDFLLMHPTDETAIALPQIIEGLLSKGYTLSTVTNALAV